MQDRIKSIPARMWQDIKQWIPVVLAIIVFLKVLDYAFGTTCTLVLATGIPCPACGMTRASFLFIRGEFLLSWYMHPVLPLIIFGVMMEGFCRYLLKKQFPWRRAYVILVIIIGLIVYSYRMIHWFPLRDPMVYREANIINLIMNLLKGGQ